MAKKPVTKTQAKKRLPQVQALKSLLQKKQQNQPPLKKRLHDLPKKCQ